MANPSDGVLAYRTVYRSQLDGPAVPVTFSWVDPDFEIRGSWPWRGSSEPRPSV
jgi:hypothetical protein